MAEQLLRIQEVCKRLNIKERTFRKHKAKLIAGGLQVVNGGRKPLFLESSLDRMLSRAAKGGRPLW